MHTVIIGNGIAGITAARTLRKQSDHRITVISGESEHHYSRPALMYLYMGHMRYEDVKPYEDWFWAKNRIDLVQDWVVSVDFERQTLQLIEHEEIAYDDLLLAVGSETKYYNWSGQDLDGVHGFVSLEDLRALERHSFKGIEQAVVVGGGLIGIELVECLHARKIPVKFVVRESSYWNKILPPEESALITKHLQNREGIDLEFGVELSEIWDDGHGAVKAIALKDGRRIKCQYVGIATGVTPSIDWLRTSVLETDRGILVNKYLQTNLPNVYAAGDCAQLREPNTHRRSIEAIWYTGRMMGETVAHNILDKNVSYDPGLYFNSAKFFDIEYQVYGQTPATLDADTDTAWFYWQHATLEKSIRLYWDKVSRAVTGFHLLGIRYRQEVCETWIKRKEPIEEVVANLGLANFDPEFFRTYEKDFIQAFNQKNGTNIQLKSHRGLGRVQRFIRKLTKQASPTTSQP